MTAKLLRDDRFAVICLIVATAWCLLAYGSWRMIVTGIRVGSPFTTREYGHHLLFDGQIQGVAVLGVIALHLCAALIGCGFVI